jgi:hypothetical protein
MNEWHFRPAADLNLPILDDPADYQHRLQLRKMIVNRDKSNNVQRWSTNHSSEVHCLSGQAEGQILLGISQVSPACVYPGAINDNKEIDQAILLQIFDLFYILFIHDVLNRLYL